MTATGRLIIGTTVALALAGCASTSTSAPASQQPTASAAATLPTTPQPPTSTTPEPATLADRLAQAGIDCSGQKLIGDVDCTYDGAKVTVSVLSWAGTEGLRRKACEAGYVNAGYQVATDGDHLTVSADFNKTTQAVAKKLGLDVRAYCP